MRVVSIDLRDFRGIADLRLTFEKHLTVLVGLNGSGKTSVLDALAIMLSQYIARLQGSPSASRRVTAQDIRVGANGTRLEIVVKDEDGTGVHWVLRKQGKVERVLRRKSSEFDSLNSYVKKIAARFENENLFYLQATPLIVYYDQKRAAFDFVRRKRRTIEHLPYAAFDDALGADSIDFNKLVFWFQERESEELRIKHRKRNYVDPQLEAVRKAIATTTGLRNPRFKFVAPRGLYFTKQGVELGVEQLSGGERAYIGLVGDLARRLAMLNPKAKNALGRQGIVLIDEMELHLHPRWQREIIPKLLKTFPGCQFVVSTHSPQVLGQIRAQSIRVLQKKRGTGIAVETPAASFGRDSNYILVSILEGTEREKAVKRQLDRIQEHIDNDRIEEATRLLERLHFDPDLTSDPELSLARVRLERRKGTRKR
ncbi:MAG: AAA family ATPase [Dongiaceae bacterium]